MVALACSQSVSADNAPKTKVVVLDEVVVPAHAHRGGRLRTPAKGWHAQMTVPESATVETKDTSEPEPPDQRDGDAFIAVKAGAFSVYVINGTSLAAWMPPASDYKRYGMKLVRREQTSDGFTIVIDGGKLPSRVFVQRKSLGLLCTAEFHDMSALNGALAACNSLVAH
jgi:hypothetical protein